LPFGNLLSSLSSPSNIYEKFPLPRDVENTGSNLQHPLRGLNAMQFMRGKKASSVLGRKPYRKSAELNSIRLPTKL
jgi:hypothetical protein